jgi:hypothetical protein
LARSWRDVEDTCDPTTAAAVVVVVAAAVIAAAVVAAVVAVVVVAVLVLGAGASRAGWDLGAGNVLTGQSR